MDIIHFSIRNPVTVIVGVILIVLFGVISMLELPIQLSPNVQEPVITVTTTWAGATPYEIERDIIEEQEKVLKGIPGLYEMESNSTNSRGQVTLRFRIGTGINDALLRVSNKLDEVPSYPENVDKPILNASGAETSPVIWLMLRTQDGNPRSVYTYRTYLENEVRQFLDRVEGVAELFIGGGVEQEMQVIVEPEKLAAYGLTIDAVIDALRGENVNISAGNLDVSRWDHRVRTVAEFRSPEDIEAVVLTSDGERQVTVSDVGRAQYGYAKFDVPVVADGEAGIAMGVRPEPNTNVLELTDRVEEVVRKLNEGKLTREQLRLDMLNEQRPYIRGSIRLLQKEILLGGALAVCVLLVFLRRISPTIVVSTAIPISIIGTFLFMRAGGSTLNIVSLAGIAFAVGMLVDNAIVVLENIDRHRSMGKSALDAAYEGTREVWGAVLASSLTTIAVFLPVVFLQDEAGQLFRDIAIAVSGAVALSLVVSMTVIPMFSKRLFSWSDTNGNGRRGKRRFPLAVALEGLGRTLSGFVMGALRLILRNAFTRLVTAAALGAGALVIAISLMPKMEYLPQGNRDLIINILIPPPGLSYEERADIGEDVFKFFHPYYEAGYEGYPGIDHIFYVGLQQFMILGVISRDQQRTRELLPLCREGLSGIPGVFSITNQAGVFQTGLGKGRTLDVDFSGNDINELVAGAGAMFGVIMQDIPGAQVRPVPSLDLSFREANFEPLQERLRAVGMTARQLGIGIDVLMDGRDIGDFKQEGEKKINLVVKAADTEFSTPEELANALMVTPKGGSVPVSSLAKRVDATGLTEVRHLERNRTISLQVTPPEEMTVQEAMEVIQRDILPKVSAMGLLENVDFGMSGTADKLTETRRSLQWNFVLAAMIIYLLMSALFGNFIYPFVIMFTLPLAAAGGLIGLKLVNLLIAPQPLDVLTMLGFIILIGVVVNNAILIVYQSLNNVREGGMDYKDAVLEATRTRIRPIYMSMTTSVFGMLPLVVWPGPGSELYRGLGSVVLGGLAFSTIFTVFMIPALLMFFIRMEKRPAVSAAPSPEGETPS